MKILRAIIRELIGLFIDDRSLALEIIAVVVFSSISKVLIPSIPLATGGILLFGCLGVILVNVAHTRFRRDPHSAADTQICS